MARFNNYWLEMSNALLSILNHLLLNGITFGHVRKFVTLSNIFGHLYFAKNSLDKS